MNRNEFLTFIESDPRVDIDATLDDGTVAISFLVAHPGYDFHIRMGWISECWVEEDKVMITMCWRDWEKNVPVEENGQIEFYLDSRYALTFDAAAAYIEQLPKPLSSFGELIEVG